MPTREIMKNKTDYITRYVNLKSKLEELYAEILKEQRHLDSGTIECAYFNYGYLLAIKDILTKEGINIGH
jgi:hypothetical protein